MESVQIAKPDAASQQLDVAIAILFAQENAVAVHTLAGAAAGIVAELHAGAEPSTTWNIAPREACGLNGKTFVEIMQYAQGLARETAQAPYSIQRFTLADTSALLAATILDLGQLRGKLTISQSVFELWNLACRLTALGPAFPYKAPVRSIFGNLSRKSVKYRLAVGRRVLLTQMDEISRRIG